MTIVNATEFEARLQRSLLEVFTAYFDGAEHRVGADTITFPSCEIKFKRQQMPEHLTRPMIIVEPLASEQERMWAGKGVLRSQRDTKWKLVVVTSSDVKSWRENDRVQTLLGVIFTGGRANFPKHGLKVLRVGRSDAIGDAAYQVSLRVVTLRAVLECGLTVAESVWAPLEGTVV